MSAINLISVFTGPSDNSRGGNPCPVELDAQGMSSEDMRAVAKKYGHESTFLFPPPPGREADYELRFFVPEHEMEMCGHATAGTTWLLNELRRLPQGRKEIVYATKSGNVRARIAEARDQRGAVAEVSQPRGWVKAVDEERRREILDVLRISEEDLHPDFPIQNACTSRVKTMVPLRSSSGVNGLKPDYSRVREVCERLESTGLYPYAIIDPVGGEEGTHVEARQFPKASGYPEDAATGIAASALSWVVLENGMLKNRTLVVRQGVAMGSPSEIRVTVDEDVDQGCWIGGTARRMES